MDLCTGMVYHPSVLPPRVDCSGRLGCVPLVKFSQQTGVEYRTVPHSHWVVSDLCIFPVMSSEYITAGMTDSLTDNSSRLAAIAWPGSPAELHPVADLNLDITPGNGGHYLCVGIEPKSSRYSVNLNSEGLQ